MLFIREEVAWFMCRASGRMYVEREDMALCFLSHDIRCRRLKICIAWTLQSLKAAPGAHWIGSRVGSTAGLDVVKNRQVFSSYRHRKTFNHSLGFCDRASWANCEVREKTNKMQQLDVYYQYFSTCFGHHYAHLQENKTCVTARGELRCFCWLWLVAVVGRCVVGCEHPTWSNLQLVTGPKETIHIKFLQLALFRTFFV